MASTDSLKPMKKDSLMFSLIIFLWLCAGFYFTPRILALLIGPENIFAKSAIILFALLLNLFWFYGFYHLVIVVFSFRKRQAVIANSSGMTDPPRIALLYATCDDFNEEAVLSCLNQDYRNFHTFILDDSGNAECKEKIDAFCGKQKSGLTVIRRPDRKGYKAGNINNCLYKISGFEYFSVSDADTILPKNYIINLLPYFNDPQVAFVQSRQELNPAQKSAFAQGLGFQIGLHYDHYLRTKDRYGFVMFYGHGALIRTKAYRQVGGFPEIATEDLAFSMKLRQEGYRGIYAQEVVCFEDYPPTYQQYRKRNEKWIRGTADCLLKYYPSFAGSKEVGWIEKFDVLISALSMLLAFPFCVFLALVGIALPFFFTHFRFQGPMFRMPLIYDNSLLGVAVNINGNLFWSWDFFLMLVIAILSPILPAIIQVLRKPKERFKYIVMYTFIFYAMQITSSLNLIAYLVSGKAGFPVTGQEEGNTKALSTANNKTTFAIEGISAVLFLFISLRTNNIWFLSFGLGIGISILLFRFGFENRLMRILVGAPLAATLVVIWFIGRALR